MKQEGWDRPGFLPYREPLWRASPCLLLCGACDEGCRRGDGVGDGDGGDLVVVGGGEGCCGQVVVLRLGQGGEEVLCRIECADAVLCGVVLLQP